VIDGSERTADATAITDCDLLVIDHRDFVPFLERRGDLCMILLRLLCSRLRKTNEHVEGALFERLEVRLAKVLLGLACSNGTPEQKPYRVQISQTELASLLGAARESVNKQLHVWQRAGLLELRKREIVVLDRAALEAMG
jgi:CRP-like cAMP-binding protein